MNGENMGYQIRFERERADISRGEARRRWQKSKVPGLGLGLGLAGVVFFSYLGRWYFHLGLAENPTFEWL